MTNQNLSEKLFKPKFNYPETTSLIERIDATNFTLNSLLDGASDSRWYRVINTLLWHWRGVPVLEIEDVLSRIAVSDKKHSNDKWLDSVIGYQSGNWIYEFLSQAAKWQMKAEQTAKLPENEENRQQLHQEWFIASQLCSIASYPHYKTDELSAQAQTYGFRAYKEAMKASQHGFKEIDFKINGTSQIKGLLHLPQSLDGTPCPIVFMCPGLTNLQTDFFQYFSEYLAPKGIGLLTIDMPSVGLSRSFSLAQNTTQLHQAVLEQLNTVPWIDHTKVIVAGFRFGAQMATRLSYMQPNRLKGLLNFGPIVHQMFVDKTVQQQLPAMYKDVIASRLGLTRISNQQLAAELNYFSLKNQGLIGRPCSIPVMSIVFSDDKLSSQSEAKLISSVKQHKVINITSGAVQKGLRSALEQSTDWITSLLK